jgi:hypothetical protein
MNRAVYVVLSDDKQKHSFSHQRDMPAACCSFARLTLRHKRLSINALWYSAHAEPIPCASAILGSGGWRQMVSSDTFERFAILRKLLSFLPIKVK